MRVRLRKNYRRYKKKRKYITAVYRARGQVQPYFRLLRPAPWLFRRSVVKGLFFLSFFRRINFTSASFQDQFIDNNKLVLTEDAKSFKETNLLLCGDLGDQRDEFLEALWKLRRRTKILFHRWVLPRGKWQNLSKTLLTLSRLHFLRLRGRRRRRRRRQRRAHKMKIKRRLSQRKLSRFGMAFWHRRHVREFRKASRQLKNPLIMKRLWTIKRREYVLAEIYRRQRNMLKVFRKGGFRLLKASFAKKKIFRPSSAFYRLGLHFVNRKNLFTFFSCAKVLRKSVLRFRERQIRRLVKCDFIIIQRSLNNFFLSVTTRTGRILSSYTVGASEFGQSSKKLNPFASESVGKQVALKVRNTKRRVFNVILYSSLDTLAKAALRGFLETKKFSLNGIFAIFRKGHNGSRIKKLRRV